MTEVFPAAGGSQRQVGDDGVPSYTVSPRPALCELSSASGCLDPFSRRFQKLKALVGLGFEEIEACVLVVE